MKKVNSKQVLEILGDLARESLPADKEGNLHLCYNDNDEVEIYFTEKSTNATTQAQLHRIS